MTKDKKKAAHRPTLRRTSTTEWDAVSVASLSYLHESFACIDDSIPDSNVD